MVSDLEFSGLFFFIKIIILCIFVIYVLVADAFDCNTENKVEIRVYDHMRVPINEDIFPLVIKTCYKIKGFYIIIDINGKPDNDFLTPLVNQSNFFPQRRENKFLIFFRLYDAT